MPRGTADFSETTPMRFQSKCLKMDMNAGTKVASWPAIARRKVG